MLRNDKKDKKDMKTIRTHIILLLLTAAFVAGCNKEESLFKGNDNYIAAFTLVKDGVTLKGAVSPDAIVITAPERLSLLGATATVTLSENATIAPDPATITDWSTAQTFTVTSYNGTKQTYAYSVERHLVSLNGDVVLLTQADVAAFVAEVDADQINGSLTIGATAGQDSVYSLAGLGHLKVITGGVIINATYAGEEVIFENLERTGDLTIASKKAKTVGFPKLTTVRMDFYVNQATAISNLYFPELVAVDKGLQIVYPDSLVSISFPKLEQIVEGLTLQGRSSGANTVRSLSLPALKTIGGNVSITYLRKLTELNIPALTSAGMITVNYLDSATAFAAPKLETVGGALSLSSCAAIASIDFSALKTVNGNISPNLTALAEVNFPALETVAGTLSFSTSATLTTLRFPALKSADALTLPNAANLTTLHFPALKYIKGELSVQLQGIASLAAFSALDSIGGRLYLYNTAQLTSLAELTSLQSAGTYYFYGVTALTELDVRGKKIGAIELYLSTQVGLTLIGDDEFAGKLYIGAPPVDATEFPITIHGFKKVGSVEFSVSDRNIDEVTLDWLEEVDGLLSFSSGSKIKRLSLPKLQKVGGLQISYYNALETLNLPELMTITGYTSGTATVGNFTYSVSSNITAVTLPQLQSIVGNLSITGLTATRPLATISFPELESLTGTFTITGTNNAVFKDLSGFSKLKKTAGITISNFTQLKNFEPLKGVIPLADAAAWKISGCSYNPTHQDMVDGKYTE